MSAVENQQSKNLKCLSHFLFNGTANIMGCMKEIEKELEGKLDKNEIEEAINKLVINTEIFKPRRGYVQRM